jgi:hypothetical protein
MGHCIQAIVATPGVADRLRAVHPRLPCVATRRGFAIIPVEAEFIESTGVAGPPQATETFMLLTDAFQDYLLDLSRFGRVAYIETEYFGGVGGQGAAAYSDRQILMEPEWAESGPINRALELIGVRRGLLGDRFSALGLHEYRSNDDLVALAASRQQ